MKRILLIGALLLLVIPTAASARHIKPPPPPPPVPVPTQWTCTKGYVALTVDDGPTSMTRQYVDRLVANGARATFYDVGNNMQARPTDVQYTVQHGMDLGDHSMTHADLPTLTTTGWQNEIKGQFNLAKTAGFTEVSFRPPYGNSSGPIWDYSESLGMRETKWSIDTNDWDGRSTSSIVSGTNGMTNQSIILIHDGYSTTYEALPTILANMKAKGLCPGRIIPSWDNPIYTSWGEPMFVNVVPFTAP